MKLPSMNKHMVVRIWHQKTLLQMISAVKVLMKHAIMRLMILIAQLMLQMLQRNYQLVKQNGDMGLFS